MNQPEFDRYSPSYEELLKDPIRDRFMAADSKFFHERKRDLIRAQFRSMQVDTAPLSYLDLGCGKGELASLLRHDFHRVAGCDPSAGMLSFAEGVETRVQDDAGKIPFAAGEFDFVTAVCVYHHVPPAARLALSQEVSRVLKPGGIFAIIEHNPYNPVTRKIVSRTPVDADAILLKAGETCQWLGQAGFKPRSPQYFLYFPESIYRRGGQQIEGFLYALPLGGQYAVFAVKEQ
jgi:SAM-dependent methyltransferase